jgi:hypothetical protein
VATLEERGHPGQAWLVFHEAKHYTNAELKAAPKRRPPILNQVGRYKGSIGQNSSALAYSYPYVCRALVRIDAMRRKVRNKHLDWTGKEQRPLDPLIRDVAEHKRGLLIDPSPRLVVFGFDDDQKKGAWAAHKARLEQEGVRVYAVGNPLASKSPAAFRRPDDIPLASADKLAAVQADAMDVKNTPASPKRSTNTASTSASVTSTNEPTQQATNQQEDEPAALIPLPPGGPNAVCLFFTPTIKGSIHPVYLCNPGPNAITELTVTTGSPSEPEMAPFVTKVPGDGILPPGHALLIEHYGLFWDGDVLFAFELCFIDGSGHKQARRTIIDKGGPKAAWVKLY